MREREREREGEIFSNCVKSAFNLGKGCWWWHT